MVLAVIALLAGAAVGYLRGRRVKWPSAGRSWDWRLPGLVPAGGILVVVGDRWIGGAVGVGILAAGYCGLIAFAVANRRRHGLALVAVGLLANLVVLLADGGMPVRAEPPGVQIGSHHHGLSADDHLAGLADTIRVAPLGETVSPGDLLTAAGGAAAMCFWLEPPDRRPRRGRARLPPDGAATPS